MKRFLLIMLGLVTVVTGASAAITAGTYTIQPYSATGSYVCASGDFNTTSGTAATYAASSSYSDGTYWTLSAYGSCWAAQSTKQSGFLNYWNASTDGGNVSSDLTNSAYNQLDIQPVSGYEDTYTILWKGDGSNSSNLYMCYTSGDATVKYKQATTPDESCYFVIKHPAMRYMANVTGMATTTSAKFTWTPGSKGAGEALARAKTTSSIESAVTVDYGTAIYTETADNTTADEFSISGVTGTIGECTKSIAKDADDDYLYIVTFAYPNPIVDLDGTYVLQSVDGTLLSLKPEEETGADDQATAASYSNTPSLFTISVNASGQYLFTLKDSDPARYIAVSSTTRKWNVANNAEYYWSVEPVDGQSYYTIQRNDDGGNLGNYNLGTAAGIKIYTGGTNDIYWYIRTAAEAWPEFLKTYVKENTDITLFEGSLFGPTATQMTTYRNALVTLRSTAWDADKTWAENLAAVDNLLTTAETAAKANWNTTPGAGKYLIYNREYKKWLTDNGTSLAVSDTKVLANNVWEFIADGTASKSTSGTQTKYQMRNRGTGRFVQISSGASGSVSGVEHMKRATVTDVCIDPTNVTAGYTVIRRNDKDGGSSDFGCIHVDASSNIVNWSYGANASQWILYKIDTDILEEDVNFLIESNSDKYVSSTIETHDNADMMTQKALTDGDNSIVWNFTKGTYDNGYKLSTLETKTGDTPYLNAINSFSGDGAEWFIRFSDYNSARYAITSSGNALPQQGWNNYQGSGGYIGTWTSNDAQSTWRFVKLDRELEDAQYNLDKIITPYADGTDASKLFYFNTILWTNYNTILTATGTSTADTEFKCFLDAYKKVQTGLVNTDFNLPADGTESYYSMKNVKYSYYLQSQTSDSSTGLIGNKRFSSANILKVAFTNDGNGGIKATIYDPVTSKYLKAATQSQQVQFETVADGGTPHSFVISPSEKMNVGGKGAMTIGENDIPNSATTFLHQGGEQNTGIYNIVGWNVTVTNNNWAAASWAINEIDELSKALIEKADAMETAQSGHESHLFYLSSDGKTAIDNAKTAIATEGGDALTEYQALETAMNSYTSYNLPSDGRYLIKSQWTDNGTKYMTNYGSLVNTNSPSYYSIWDITRNKTDETFNGTYTFVNEGSAYCSEPLTSNVGSTHTPGKPYLCYDSSKTTTSARTYVMGGTVAENGTLTPGTGTDYANIPAKMKFICNGDGTFSMQAEGDPYYACIAILKYSWQEGIGAGSEYDENIQSGVTNSVNQYWTLERFDAGESPESPTTDDEGIATTYGEQTIFYNNAKTNKEYYVGGPITLTNVDAVASLKDYVALITDRKKEIGTNGGSSNIDNAATCAGYYRETVNFLNGTDVTDMPEGATTTKLDPVYLLNLSTDKVFYMENKSRPENKARLVNLDGATRCKTVSTTDKNWDSKYSQWTMEAVGDYFYIKNVGTGKYISARSAGEKDMVMTDNTSSAAQISISEVVPGIYLVYDTKGDVSEKYMTINGSNELTYYGTYELSTMWKIYSINEVKSETAQYMAEIAGDDGVKLNGFTTFSYPIATRISSTIGAEVYYGTNARLSSDGKLYVDLNQLTAFNGYYDMEANKGYAILTASTECSYDPDNSIQVGGQGTKIKDNILVASSPITITTDNWKNYYVLEYHTTSEVVGTWGGKNLRGVGLGFYRPVVGSTINARQAYLPDGLFGVISKNSYKPATFDDATARSNDYSWQGEEENGPGQIPCKVILHDANGNVTGIIQTDADGQMRIHKIYDLNGRQLQEAKSGINIIDGKTVIVK